jgi:hypothetical protein
MLLTDKTFCYPSSNQPLPANFTAFGEYAKIQTASFEITRQVIVAIIDNPHEFLWFMAFFWLRKQIVANSNPFLGGLQWVGCHHTCHCNYGQWQATTHFPNSIWHLAPIWLSVSSTSALKQGSEEQILGRIIRKNINPMDKIMIFACRACCGDSFKTCRDNYSASQIIFIR